MTFATHNARVTAPLQYRKQDGTTGQVPSGACLMEQTGETSMDIIWGLNGENSATLSVDVVKAAAEAGNLILLD